MGVVPLTSHVHHSHLTAVHPLPPHTNCRHFQFEVTTVSRVYLLGCDSEPDRSSWLVDFQRVGLSGCRRGGGGEGGSLGWEYPLVEGEEGEGREVLWGGSIHL